MSLPNRVRSVPSKSSQDGRQVRPSAVPAASRPMSSSARSRSHDPSPMRVASACSPVPPWRKGAGTKLEMSKAPMVVTAPRAGAGVRPATALSKEGPNPEADAPIGTAITKHLAGLRQGQQLPSTAAEAFLKDLRKERAWHVELTRESVRAAQSLKKYAKEQARSTFQAMGALASATDTTSTTRMQMRRSWK